MQKIYMEQNFEKITTKEAFENFIRHRKVRNLSPNTIKTYESDFRYFSDFYDSSRLCADIKKETVYGFIEYLRENTNANDITIYSYMTHIRAILYYFMEEGYTKKFSIEMPKKEKTIKPTYTDRELVKLLEKPNLKKCEFTDYRNWVMVNYLLATGNRLRTMINLKIGDIDFDNNLICMLKTKNKKQQIIPLSKQLKPILQEYLRYRKGSANDYMFCSMHGTQLSTSGVEGVISKYNRGRGVESTSIHKYRHTFAKKWILNGGDPFTLKEVLGHSTMDMVNQYVNIFGKDLENVFNSYNPLDNFLKDTKGELINMR